VCVCLFYTSGTTGVPKGTTGVPKGVMCTQKAFLITAAAYIRVLPLRSTDTITDQHIVFSYLPTAHVFSHASEMMAIMVGWKIGYFSGSTARMISDAQALGPTIMAMVPRVAAKIRQSIEAGINEKGGITKMMFNMAVKSKIKALKKAKPETPIALGKGGIWDK
ncbi:hypothetical protein KIPB_012236, partial [Kipferlia bialata]